MRGPGFITLAAIFPHQIGAVNINGPSSFLAETIARLMAVARRPV